jgi:hypothetical protein
VPPDPLQADLDHAADLARSGDIDGAIVLYRQVLQGTTDPGIHADAFYGLLAIAAQAHYQASQDWPNVCGYDETAVSAYEPLLQTNDRPDTGFYASAVEAELSAVQCRTGAIGTDQSDPGQISLLLEKMALFPPDASGVDKFSGAILNDYRFAAMRDYATRPQEILAAGQVIQAQVGERTYNGKKVSAWIDEIVLQARFCGQTVVPSTALGTSSAVKVFSCSEQFSAAVVQAGLAAANPEEIHYALRYDWIGSGELDCVGTNADTGRNFTYSYPNSWIEMFSLVDVRTGQVVNSKTFPSSAPSCSFTYCSVDPSTDRGSCQGGQGVSTVDQADLVRWLEEVVK